MRFFLSSVNESSVRLVDKILFSVSKEELEKLKLETNPFPLIVVAVFQYFSRLSVFCHLAKSTTMSKMSRFLFIAFLTFIDRKGRGSFQASVLTSYVFRELGTKGYNLVKLHVACFNICSSTKL